MKETNYKYFAFISYTSKDAAWGKRLQRRLEGFRLPTTLCSERGLARRPMKPVFFAPYDIQPGDLSEELKARLRAARHLVVVCSPRSAASEWVGKEIRYFHSLGRPENLHLFIVDGVPHSGDTATECFHPVLRELGLPELLGANVHERFSRWPWVNRERAYVQLVTKLLGVEFDTLWRRHLRQRRQRALAAGVLAVGVAAALGGVWAASRPVDVAVQVEEAGAVNRRLPPLADAVVTLRLDNEEKTDTVALGGGEALFANVPRRYVGSEVGVSVRAARFLPLDTVVTLSPTLSLALRRDPAVFGHVAFTLCAAGDLHPLPGVAVSVGGRPAVTDAEGRVRLDVPLAEQRTAYAVTAAFVPLEDDSIVMPCGPDDVIMAREGAR